MNKYSNIYNVSNLTSTSKSVELKFILQYISISNHSFETCELHFREPEYIIFYIYHAYYTYNYIHMKVIFHYEFQSYYENMNPLDKYLTQMF